MVGQQGGSEADRRLFSNAYHSKAAAAAAAGLCPVATSQPNRAHQSMYGSSSSIG